MAALFLLFFTAGNMQVSCILSSLWSVSLVRENIEGLNLVLLSSATERSCAGLVCPS